MYIMKMLHFLIQCLKDYIYIHVSIRNPNKPNRTKSQHRHIKLPAIPTVINHKTNQNLPFKYYVVCYSSLPFNVPQKVILETFKKKKLISRLVLWINQPAHSTPKYRILVWKSRHCCWMVTQQWNWFGKKNPRVWIDEHDQWERIR